MKISEMIKNLQEFMAENGDLECWYARDDEGNGYQRVYYDPTLMYKNEYSEVFAQEDYDEADEDDREDLESICIVNLGKHMDAQRREEAIKFIESQLEYGYVDLGTHDRDELEIIKEAINMMKTIDKFNSIGCTSFQMTADEIKEILERQENA